MAIKFLRQKVENKTMLFVSMNINLKIAFIGVFLTVCDPYVYANDDMLDYLPAILAASIGECDLRNQDKLRANCTVVVTNNLDLGGGTIYLPSNVELLEEGGKITNGTLVFNGGRIDGELLNSTLTIRGDVKLTSDTFVFYPDRWDIVQGRTTKAIALQNNQKLEALFNWIKKLGGSTFKIDQFDAYFEVTTVTSTTTNQNFYPSVESVNLPSDFTLVMTNRTHLRVYPYHRDSANNGTLLGIREVENVVVRGGNLHGDRYEYYLTEDNEEGNTLLTIRSGKNIIIDNVNFEDSSVTSLTINSVGFSFNPDYDPSDNVTIKNSTFRNNRGMSLSITDGRNLTIQNNNFIDSSQPTDYSDGGAVGYAINIEPVRTRDSNGNLVEYQKVFDVLIKGNTETNSRAGFLIVFVGQDVIVEENTIDTRMSWSLTSGVRIRNNTFDATNSWASESWAFSAGGVGETVFDNEFSGNTIKGYGLGINMSSVDADIFDNTITDVSVGIQVNDALYGKIFDNTIEANNRGIYIGNTSANGVEIMGNSISSEANLMVISAVNEASAESDYSVTVDDNIFSGGGYLSLYRANGFTVSNNQIDGGISIAADVANATINRNTIRPSDSHGISLTNSHDNVVVSNNTIFEPTGATRFECLSNASTTPSEVTLVNNSCN